MRTRSLFWTFAGVFLLVLAAATVLQVFVNVAVLRPLQVQSTRDRAALALARAAQELAGLPDIFDNEAVVRCLHAHRVEGTAVLLVYRGSDGHVVPERLVQPAVQRQIMALLAETGPVRTAEPEENPPPPRKTDGSPPLPQGDLRREPGSPQALQEDRAHEPPPPPSPDDRKREPAPPPPPPDDRKREPAPPPPPPDDRKREPTPPPPPPDDKKREPTPPPQEHEDKPRESGPPRPPRRPLPLSEPGEPQPVPGRVRVELLGRQPVTSSGQILGEVLAFNTTPHASLWSLAEMRALLLFMPFAVLAAGSAGLLMVRILARRLKALEFFATRVTDGDLGARVVDARADEIGRLGERLNRMTERLAAARAQLETTDQQRRRLLADITHELATPLTSIRGYVETLLDPQVPTSPEERSAYLNDVLEEAKRLDLLIGDLFDLTRLEADTSPLKLKRLDWMALCRNTMRRFEPRFREAGLQLQWTGSEGEAWVRADGRRMEQVVENLLVNALRYVPSGGNVELALERVATPAGERFRLTVSDDGPGIAPADLPHVFERFYRADAVRGSGGSGLGLAIVHEIVRKHGGDTRVEVRPPHGATFLVEIPCDPLSPQGSDGR